MVTRLWIPLAATLLLGSATYAQVPRTTTAPVEVRLRSINDLLSKADYIAGLIGQQQLFRGFVQQIPIDPQQGLFGLDTRRPIGLYGDISLDVEQGAGVFLVPVANLETLMGFLQARAGLQIERKGNGIMSISLPPGSPVEALYARFTDGYLYVANHESHLDAKKLIPAKNFFAQDDGAVASVVIRPDRIPVVMRRELLAKLDETLQELQREALTKDNPAERAGFILGGKSVINLSRTLIEDVKELHLKLFVDEKRDFISLDLTVVPQPNSPVAKNFASLGQRTSLAYGLTNVKGAVLRGNVNFALTDDTRKMWDDLINNIMTQALDEVPPQNKDAIEKILQGILPTLKAAVADAAITMTAPNAKGHYTVLGAISVKEGKKLEDSIRELVKLYERDTGDTKAVKLNFAKVGNFNLHQIDRILPPEAEAYLGSRTLWLATSEDLAVFSVGPDASLLRNALSNGPTRSPALSLDVSLVGLARLANENATPQQVNAIATQIFGRVGPVGRDMLRLEVAGGQNLTLRLSVQGGGIRFLAALASAGP